METHSISFGLCVDFVKRNLPTELNRSPIFQHSQHRLVPSKWLSATAPVEDDSMNSKKFSISEPPKKASFGEDASPSRWESKTIDASRKRDSTLQEPSSRRESRIHGAYTTGRRESHMLHPDPLQPVPRYSRASRASLQWHQRPSLAGSHRSEGHLKHVAIENTYRLSPTEEERFSTTKVEKLLEEFLANYLGGEQYDAQKCSQMVQQISDIIKERVKKMDFRRHKLNCHVVIGQNLGQGIQLSSRCLWDSKNDSSATATYSNNSLFAVATVYALYFE